MRRMSKVWQVFLLAAVMIVLTLGSAVAAETVDTVQPENVKFHLYDYWGSDNAADRLNEDTPKNANGEFNGGSYKHTTAGINDGHALLFLGNDGGLQYGWWNARTAGRLVKPYLVNGYPELDLARDDHTELAYDFPVFNADLKDADGTTPVFSSGASANENLKYLFDTTSDVKGKVSFPATHLLMKDDAKGRYYFDSRYHFAQFDETSKKFTLYDRTGMSNDVYHQYRFFPFNTQSDFETYWKLGSGTLYDMNHFFGVMMEVEFYQTPDGKIKLADGTSADDMKFHFSGDDDVVVFVDNLLVGSVGGIHGRRAIDINFRTGEVTQERDGMKKDAEGNTSIAVNNNSTTVANELNHGDTTIKAYYDMALARLQQSEADGGMGMTLAQAEAYLPELTETETNGLAAGTLMPNTRHTLRMYYLERGNWDSNMEISFNLFYPYNEFTVQNTIVGGNQTLRDTDLIYDLSFDMSGVMGGLLTDDTTFEYEAFAAGSDTAVEKGTVKINRTTGKITTVTPADGRSSKYLNASSQAYLSDGESVVFNLPDETKVTVEQHNPTAETLNSLGLNANPYKLDTMTVTPDELKIADAKPQAQAKVMAASYPTVVAYRNVIQTGSLKVVKNVVPLGDNLPETDYTFTFNVTVPAIGQADGKTYPAVLTAKVKAGETAAEAGVITDVILGAAVTIEEVTDGLTENRFHLSEGGGEYVIESAEETKEITFKNQYAAAITKSLSGAKTLDGVAPEAGKFSFIIESVAEDTPMPEQTTVSNDAEGHFTFGPITYAKPGEYTYIISEVWGDDPYIDYDTETSYQAVVKVTPSVVENSIVLVEETKITKVGDESGAEAVIAFANTTRGGVQIKLRKLSSYDECVLPGAEFTLTHDPKVCPACQTDVPAVMTLDLSDEQPTQETEGPKLNMQDVTTKTATTDQYGAIIFSGLVEGHIYTLEETKAPADYNLPATNTWEVANVGGTILVDQQPLSGALVIHNRPTYWPMELELRASKTMEGKTPDAEHKFAFDVLDEDGNVIRESENVLGEIAFEPFLIVKPGTYRYEIVERVGEDDGIVYDSVVYTVVAEVKAVEVMTDEGAGTGDYMLSVDSITYLRDGLPYTGEMPVFANTKIPPMPPTGDDSRMGLWLALLGVSAAGVLLILARRRGRTQ